MGTPVIPKFWRKRKQEIAEFQTNMVIYRESQASLDNIKRPCHKEKKITSVSCTFFGMCVSYECIYTCEGLQRTERTSNIFLCDSWGTPDSYSYSG